MTNREFFNHFKGIKKTERDMYNDLTNVWAEYEYIRISIISRLKEIIDNYEHDYSDVTVFDNEIIVKISPVAPMQMINEIQDYLGIPGEVFTKKKTDNIFLKFIQQDERCKNDRKC